MSRFHDGDMTLFMVLIAPALIGIVGTVIVFLWIRNSDSR